MFKTFDIIGSGLESLRFRIRFTPGPSTGLQANKMEKVPPGYSSWELGDAENEPTSL